MAPSTVVAVSPVELERSWAQAVRRAAGEESNTWESQTEEEDVAVGLRPAQRGERLCRCFGQVLVMLRHYGWIAPLSDIDHPDVHWNGGRIYVAADDIEAGTALRPGDRVSFFLYVDSQGLGAEGCRVVQSTAAARGPATPRPAWRSERWTPRPYTPYAFSANATQFVPIGAHTRSPNLSPEMDKFAPYGGTSWMNPSATEFVPAQHLQFNATCFSDSEDESDGGAEAGDERSDGLGEWESDREEEFNAVPMDMVSSVGSTGLVELDDELDVVVLCAPLKVPHQRADSLDGSTCASDAEDEVDGIPAALCSLSTPPGLSVLAAA